MFATPNESSSPAPSGGGSVNVKQHGSDDNRCRPGERAKRLCAPRLYVSDFWRASYLPLGISALQLWHLQLVPCANPLARERIAEAEGVELEPGHALILTLRLHPRQYDC